MKVSNLFTIKTSTNLSESLSVCTNIGNLQKWGLVICCLEDMANTSRGYYQTPQPNFPFHCLFPTETSYITAINYAPGGMSESRLLMSPSIWVRKTLGTRILLYVSLLIYATETSWLETDFKQYYKEALCIQCLMPDHTLLKMMLFTHPQMYHS